jgi:hypothetical protein
MRRKWLLGALASVVGATSLGCGLSEQECSDLRSKAFDIVNDQQRNNPHVCDDDTQCVGTEWPGCTGPVNQKNRNAVDGLRKKFDDGKCVEPPPTKPCAKTPEIYCKQGLCTFYHTAGEATAK